MNKTVQLITLELLQLFRDRTFSGLMGLLLILMVISAWNSSNHIAEKKKQNGVQQNLVEDADKQLTAQIDSLNQGLASYEDSYTLPTNGVRLTYNNHRIATLPLKPFSLIAIGQSDLYSNYKKIVLYYNDSYDMDTKELESPIEQLFGQLDLAFVWVYLMPLIILLASFNILSIERETGRLPLIASQPIKVWRWLAVKLGIRFLTIIFLLALFTFPLLAIFEVPVWEHGTTFGKLLLILMLYNGFWFLLSFLVNLLGYTSGKNLIILTSIWVLFVFLVPSAVNQIGKKLHPIPSRLEIINNHQEKYNEVEKNYDDELKGLYEIHKDWYSDDPVTKDMSNSTGWNINYLAKQYMAQLKHRPVALAYERKVDEKNSWLGKCRSFSPAMILNEALTEMAGTSTKYYRSYLRQATEYASLYRQYVFKGIFTNHAFTKKEIENLPKFEFDNDRVESTFLNDISTLIFYTITLLAIAVLLIKGKRITTIQ